MGIQNLGRATNLTGTQNTQGTAGTDTTQGTTPAAGTTPQAPLDAFQASAAPKAAAAQEATPAQKQWATAVSNYTDKLTDIAGGNALAMADAASRGTKTAMQGGAFTEAQQKEALGATKDLFMNMPVSVLAPGAKDFLASQGVDLKNADTATLKDLGKAGGDLAKKLANDFKDKSPAAFYGVAAAGAVAVGAYGAMKGSDKLEKLGIKPEFDTKVFNDQVTLKAKASWGEKFKDPNLTVGSDGKFKINPGTIGYGVSTTVGGESVGKMKLKSADASVSFEGNNGVNASASVKLDGTKVESGKADVSFAPAEHLRVNAGVDLGAGGKLADYRVGARYETSRLTATADATLDPSGGFKSGSATLSASRETLDYKFQGNLSTTFAAGGRLETLGGSVDYQQDKFKLSGQIEHNFITDTTKGTGQMSWQPRRDIDVGAKAWMDDKGDKGVGVGVTIHF